MTDLLGPEDLAEYRSAMDDLKDTFHKDTCQYLKYGEQFSLMDNQTPAAPVIKVLDCRVTKLQDTVSETDKSVEGTKDENQIEIRFFARYLISENLMTGNVPVFKVEKDFFTWQGSRYILDLISYDDSDFGGQVELVVCHCTKMIEKA
jgi:hypothetical protein